jgi:uncharacterized protein (TIGR03435 family)
MIADLTNHLWQSTLFAAVVGLLALVLRKNRARIRFCLWLSASLKFFVPFALLISLGRQLESVPAAQQIATPSVSYTVEQFTEPFSAVLISVPDMPATAPADVPAWLPRILLFVWLVGFAAVVMMRIQAGRKVRAALRASTLVQVDWGVPVRVSSALLEPGVVGMFRPTLLLPDGIVNRLTSSQLAAVVAHELCHVRRRDNLTSGLHMIVEAVFWFHPLVWWIGARLVEERERACDEEVLRLGNEPMVYAEGILNVCKFYQESPLISVPGVTGSDLKRRIEDIMKNRRALKLGLGKILLLALVGILAFTAPIAMGVVHAMARRPLVPVPRGEPVFPAVLPVIPAQAPQAPLPSTQDRFEVVSIRAAEPGAAPAGGARGTRGGGPGPVTPCGGMLQITPGRITIRNSTVHRLLVLAYGKNCRATQEVGLIVNAPDWVPTQAFDIQATLPAGAPTYSIQQLQNGEAPRLQAMLQSMLADRFQLRLHRDSKEAPIYNLVFVKEGRIKLSADQTPLQPLPPPVPFDPSVPPPPQPRGGFLLGVDPPAGKVMITATAIPISTLINVFQGQEGRFVIDKTGMKGLYDILPQVTFDVGPFEIGPGAVSVWPEIMQQLGLKLESARGPVETLVLDRIEKPSEN